MNKNRLLVLNYEFPPLGGGASPVGYEIASRLSLTKEFSVDVVTMGYGDLPKYEIINDNFRVYRVKCIRRKKEICYPWEQLSYLVSAYFKCRKLIKSNKYDLCHVHFLIPTGILAWVLKKEFGLKYIVTVHGSDVPGFNPDRFKFLHKFTRPLLRQIGLGAESLISPSDFLKKKIVKKIDKSLGDKTVIIPNGIDVNIFNPKPKKKYIVSTGRLLKRKGFQFIIKALINVDLGYELYICGDGPMLNELKHLARDSKTKVNFCGWLKNTSERYLEIMNEAAIYISASSIENASISLLEAMSSGCAVISSDIEANQIILGDSGIFFKVNDDLDLNQQIKLLVNNEDLIDKYQKSSRRRAEEHYNWDKINLQYINHINKFIN
jgi:glycosyltransferase involved in cell wall biosynthesis